MDIIIINKSDKPLNKYDAILNNKKISFGAAGMSDYTLHKDDERKQRYINRHRKNENWQTPSPGFFSRWVLWNKKTLKESINDINKRFNLNVKLK